MAGLNLSQTRIVDPVLTSIAQGYQNNEMVAQFLFPRVDVTVRGGQIIQFGKEAFMLYAAQRAPGENTKRVQFGYAGVPFALVDYSLEGQVPIENLQEAENGPGIDAAQIAIDGVGAIFDLRLEKFSADLARNAANYPAANKITLSGTSQWSDFSGVSSPASNIETGKEAIRAATGRLPNTMVMGPSVLSRLRLHPAIIDRMKYTGRDVATPEFLGALFGIERVVVGNAIYSNDAGTGFTDVWGKDVVLAYTNLAAVRSRGTPTYGYTYNLRGYPQAEEPYMDRNAKSWLYPVDRSEAPVIAAASAGYLITNAVA
jgi:hypothetical protein